MRIIISPAKKMRDLGAEDCPADFSMETPVFLKEAARLQKALWEKSPAERQALWACSSRLAEAGSRNLRTFSFWEMALNAEVGRQAYLAMSTPALLSYEGIQYQYMAPAVFSRSAWAYVQEHLRILSGFYGILKPMDGVVPYRLEMQAKLALRGAKNLYEFWGRSLYGALEGETDTIVNLASLEYSQAISRHLSPGMRFLTCVFAEKNRGRLRVKGTKAKMARGEMVRFLAENQIEKPADLREFDRLNYVFSPEDSKEEQYVFIERSDHEEGQKAK